MTLCRRKRIDEHDSTTQQPE